MRLISWINIQYIDMRFEQYGGANARSRFLLFVPYVSNTQCFLVLMVFRYANDDRFLEQIWELEEALRYEVEHRFRTEVPPSSIHHFSFAVEI